MNYFRHLTHITASVRVVTRIVNAIQGYGPSVCAAAFAQQWAHKEYWISHSHFIALGPWCSDVVMVIGGAVEPALRGSTDNNLQNLHSFWRRTPSRDFTSVTCALSRMMFMHS